MEELQNGSDLIGEVPMTNMLAGKFTPALATVQELHESASRVRPVILSETSGSGDDEIDRIVWNKIMEEVEKGWLLGPLEEDPHLFPGASVSGRRKEK